MFENVKWLFFDMGSTLIDEHFCYEQRLKEIADFASKKYEVIYEQAIAFYKQNKKGDLELLKLYDLNPIWHTEKEVLYEDANICLERLHQKYKIGIIANQKAGSEDRLAQYGVLKYIDLVIASAEEGVSKPDKRIFKIALERSGCEPEQAIMIGDRIDNDIVPAKALGMKTIWIKQGFGQYWNIQGEEEVADLIVDNLTGIWSILK